MNAVNFPKPFHRCWAEIDLSALRHNVAVTREWAGSGVAIAAVLKANAYGHGLARLARELRPQVEMFAVANVAEALELRQAAPGSPVLILGPALPEEREAIIRERFLPVISSVGEAQAYAAEASRIAPSSPFAPLAEASPLDVHLAVDTGMGRIGVEEEEALAAARTIATIPGLRLAGVGTHLPVADEDFEWTRAQLARWREIVRSLRAAGLNPAVHAFNSAGTMRFSGPEGGGAAANGGIVRAGLMLYGSSPLPEFQHRLLPLLTWKTRVTLLREVPKGRSVSYGRTFITPGPMRIATLGAGYGDGYPRRLSNAAGEILLGGQRCPVLGRVTMDQILVDASAVPGIEAGDEAVLMGRQGTQEILAAELAAKAGTIAWEIFTGITSRVVRRYL